MLDIGEEISIQKERNRINLGILEIVDKVIEDFIFGEVKFNEVKFFESNYDVPEIEKREYGIIFFDSETRYVYWELELVYPKINFKLPIKVDWRYINLASGTQMNSSNTEIELTPIYQGLRHYHGWGYKEKGNWGKGRYILEMFYKKRKVVSNEFEIK